MRLLKRDIIATGLVSAAGIVYLLWAIDASPPGLSGTRATGLVVLAWGSRPPRARWSPASRN